MQTVPTDEITATEWADGQKFMRQAMEGKAPSIRPLNGYVECAYWVAVAINSPMWPGRTEAAKRRLLFDRLCEPYRGNPS